MLVDLAFPVQGPTVPADHRARLAGSLAERLPWLGVLPGTGMHRLNLAHGGGGLLSGRTRMTLRVPEDRAEATAQQLAGTALNLGDVTLHLGPPTVRTLLPHRTLYAHFVDAEGDDEPAFLARMDRELRALGVVCNTVCGREQALPVPGGQLVGYSLLLDGLVPETALRVLEAGLGSHRALGCGLFVPHKSAAAVGT